MCGLFGTTAMWAGLAVLLVATLFVRNLYCRFLCPVGAALGILSNLTVFRIKRWSECKTCKICERTCEWGAIRGPTIVKTECVRCDDCERLYLDQQKCPHWIVLRRKGNAFISALRHLGLGDSGTWRVARPRAHLTLDRRARRARLVLRDLSDLGG